METTRSATPDGLTGVVAAAAVLLGLFVTGYGLLLVPLSLLGGLWIAAIGVSLALAGAFASERFGEWVGVDPATRRNLAVGFGVLAVLLLVAFAVVNGMTFEANEATGGSTSG